MNAVMIAKSIAARRPGRRGFLPRLLAYPPGAIAILLLVALCLTAIAVGFLPLPDPTEFSPDVLKSPSTAHLFGTDNWGRDLASRVVWGLQTSLIVAILSAGLSIALGTVLGAIAGFFGGVVDDVLSRVFDIFLLLPAFFLLLLVVALFGPSLAVVIVVIGLATWPRPARIMRSQALTYRNRVFVEAARAAGAGPVYLLIHHVIPNGIAPVITYGTVLMGQAILIEAGLSYLALSDPKLISWGRLILDGQHYLEIAPWMSVLPGLTMMFTVLALNIAGDALNYALQGVSAESGRGR